MFSKSHTRAAFMVAFLFLLFGSTRVAAEEIDLKAKFPKEAEKLEEKLRDLAQGNDRSASVDKATIDSNSGEVTVELSIRSRHAWKAFGKKVVAYDWTVSGKASFNPRTGNIKGEVDFGRGIKMSVSEISKALSSAK